MKKAIFTLCALLSAVSTYALPAGTYSKQLKNWGVGTSGNATGMAFSLVAVDDPNTIISFDTRLQDTIEKQKILAAMLASIKYMGGRIQIEIGPNNQIVNLYDNN
jgi:hypothetical protein